MQKLVYIALGTALIAISCNKQITSSQDIEAKDKIFIDFNKAYNPPCAFTDFATCVFAPEQNHLDFKVMAGETYLHQEQ